jgi:aspartate/methionine/tyrosine aminotransferase
MDLGILEDICAWAGEHGIWILSDEIYRRLYFDGDSAPSVFDVKDRPGHVVALDGMSKAFSMPGWRIGWSVGPPELIRKASALQSQTTSAAAGPSQYAAAPLPPGAIYMYGRLGSGDQAPGDSAAVAESLLMETGVATVPGEAFGTPGFLRLNFSVEDKIFAEGSDRIRAWFGST